MAVETKPQRTPVAPKLGKGQWQTVRTVSGEDWGRVRTAFVERATQPYYCDLAEEFSIQEKTIATAAVQQGWPMLRAARMEQKLKEAGAGEIVLKALAGNRAVVNAGETVTLLMFQQIGKLCQELTQTDAGAMSSRINLANTLSFALNNAANAAKSLGIVGIPKGLGDAGAASASNGLWRPEILNQINVTLKGISKGETVAVSTGASAAEDI